MKNPEVTQDIYNRIAKNSLYNLLRRFLGFPVGLILPPVVLSYIGVEGYGVWAFIQTLVAYSIILDMGSDAMTKYTAEYKSQEKYLKIARIFNTFFVVYSILFVIFFLAVFIYQDWIIDVFIKTDKFPREDISFALVLYTAVFGINMVFKVYSSFLNGLEMMDLTNKVEMLSVTCNFIFSIAFLCLGWGIKGLAIASGLSTLITGSIYVGVCAKVAPYLKLNPLAFINFGILSEVYKFITYGALGGIAAMAHFQLSKVIITYFLGLKYLTYYDLGSKLVFFSWGLLGSFIIPIMPAASGVYANLGEKKMKELFQTTFKYMVLMITPVFLFTSVMAYEIIFAWLGPGYEETAFVLRFLSVAYLILALTGPGAMILSGMGMPEIPFYGGIIAAVISVTLSLVLVTKFGLAGIIIGTLSAYTLSAIYGFYYFQKKLGGLTNILRYLKFPLLTSMAILLILSFIGKYIRNYHIELVSAAILFPITYIMLTYKNPEYGRIRDFIRRPLSTFRGLM